MTVAYLDTSIMAARRAPWFARGSSLLFSSDVQNGWRSEAKDWHFHSAGNGRIAFAIVSPSGFRPASIASTISGANNVIRSSRLTYDGLMFSATATSWMHRTPVQDESANRPQLHSKWLKGRVAAFDHQD